MNGSLFEEPEADPIEVVPADAPLADRMRPRSLEEFRGQQRIVGPGSILSGILEEGSGVDLTQSLILWGPPGCGKTTLARLLASRSSLRFVPFSAVLSGVKEVRAILGEAERQRARGGSRTLLFVDEIHRFNRAQQDAFLPHVERGDIVLIGATTENPSFEVNNALLSRSRTLALEPLSVEELAEVLRRAIEDPERGLGGAVVASQEVLVSVAHAADGDARRALNLIETASSMVGPGEPLNPEILSRALQRKASAYDKSGEEHYNLASALQKSVRNSSEDAALYWVTRMLEGGEERRFVARRLIRIAVEDIGLADPFALRIALDAADAFDRLGSPEGDLALVQATVYLARAKKSNALLSAYGAAKEDVQRSSAEPVPLHLRNASTQLMKEAGYGAGYRYAHTDPDASREMECMPPSLAGRSYFKRGREGS